MDLSPRWGEGGGAGDHSAFRYEMKEIRTIHGVFITVSLHT